MNRCLVVISLPIVIALVALTEGAERGDPGGLSLSMVIGKDESGRPTIDYHRKFHVLFTNRLKNPLRLWSEQCQLGYSTLSFRVDNGEGSATIMPSGPRTGRRGRTSRRKRSLFPPAGNRRRLLPPLSSGASGSGLLRSPTRG